MQISIRSAASLMQIISTAFEDTGRSGKPERLFFFPEGRTYSPPARRAGGGIPPSSGTRALCEPSTGCFSRGQPMPQRIPAVIVCAAGRRLSPHLHLRCKPLSLFRTTCHPPAKICHSTRHALRVRQLYRSYGRCFPAPSIFF